MHRLFARQPSGSAELKVRPATRADRAELTRLTERSRRTHFHLDWWTLDDWIGDPASNAWIALAGPRVAGALIAPQADTPVAWVRLASVEDGFSPGVILGALMPPALAALRAAGIASLACLSYPDWLSQHLLEFGFAPYSDVAHFRKDDAAVPDAISAAAVRTARVDDLPAVLTNDRAAFDPIWWHTLDSLERILRSSALFIVAEIEDRVAGHAFTDRYGNRGHLVRLAVHPHHQRRGIGAHLLARSLAFLVVAGATPITLNTQSDNYSSQTLYRRFGFVPTGESTTVMVRAIGA